MRYSDLVQFDPIESVVQLRESNQADKARELVRTYAVSDDMAERLRDLLFPNLILEGNPDTRGALIVGNYGSGKSHLMAVITALAEDADLLQEVKNEIVKKSAAGFAGRFKVIRMEIGSTTMPLREILTGALTKNLAAIGIDYAFKEAHEVSENKTALEDMMASFHKVYPDQGLLLAVDGKTGSGNQFSI